MLASVSHYLPSSRAGAGEILHATNSDRGARHRTRTLAWLVFAIAFGLLSANSFAQTASELYTYCVAKRAGTDYYSNVFPLKPASHAVPVLEYAKYIATKFNEPLGVAQVTCSIPIRTQTEANEFRNRAITNVRTVAHRTVVEEDWTFTGAVGPESQQRIASSPSTNRAPIVSRPAVPLNSNLQTSPQEQPQIAPLKEEVCQAAQVRTTGSVPAQRSVPASNHKLDTLAQADFHTDPELYTAKLQLEDASKLDQVREAFRPLVQGQSASAVWANVGRLAATADSIVKDMSALVQMNAYWGPTDSA